MKVSHLKSSYWKLQLLSCQVGHILELWKVLDPSRWDSCSEILQVTNTILMEQIQNKNSKWWLQLYFSELDEDDDNGDVDDDDDDDDSDDDDWMKVSFAGTSQQLTLRRTSGN